MDKKQWEKLKEFLEENGIEYELKTVSIFMGKWCVEVLLPLVEFGGQNEG